MTENNKNDEQVVTEEDVEEVPEETIDETSEETTQPITIKDEVLPGVSRAMFDNLTNKNQQFIINVDKQINNQITDGIKQHVYLEIVETLIDGQQVSQTARQIYGTPTETAKVIIDQELVEPTEEGEKSPDWQIAVDGGLMLGSIYTLITGISLLNADSANAASFMGLITLIINYVTAGLAMLAVARVMPDFEAPKGKKGIWKYLLVSMLAMFAWFIVVAGSAVVIPPSINPVFNAQTYIIIGAVTLVVRFLLKKQLNIKGGVF